MTIENDSSEQDQFWKSVYASEYIKKNSVFDQTLGVKAWRKILQNTSDVSKVLECGSNIGRNCGFLNEVLPAAEISIIEISKQAFDTLQQNNKLRIKDSFNGSLLDAHFFDASYDIVFTMGVLIHINPDMLIKNMQKIYNLSRKYIIFGEYFSSNPETILYQGQSNKHFKRDFGKFFLQNFKVKTVDYGFLWGEEFGAAGFDDVTYWVFEKK